MGIWSFIKNALRDERKRKKAKAAPRRWYWFYYPKGREPGSGWKYPKQYGGPFETKASIEADIRGQMKKWGEKRPRYRAKHLTPAGFKKIWGALPGKNHPGH